MDRKARMILWIIATVIGTAGVSIIVRAFITGGTSMYGIILLGVMTVILVFTWVAEAPPPGKDKGDTA
jgi:hypothetical protein